MWTSVQQPARDRKLAAAGTPALAASCPPFARWPGRRARPVRPALLVEPRWQSWPGARHWIALIVLGAACRDAAPPPCSAAAAADSRGTCVESPSRTSPETVPQSGAAPVPDAAGTTAAAADVIRRYYEAIDTHRYRTAYELWEDGGAASGQSFAAFAAGFAHTERVTVEIGEPGRIGAAAGSRYVEIPVTIRAILSGGTEQHFTGSYTLRRAVVDGATTAQRQWHIYRAEIARAR